MERARSGKRETSIGPTSILDRGYEHAHRRSIGVEEPSDVDSHGGATVDIRPQLGLRRGRSGPPGIHTGLQCRPFHHPRGLQVESGSALHIGGGLGCGAAEDSAGHSRSRGLRRQAGRTGGIAGLSRALFPTPLRRQLRHPLRQPAPEYGAVGRDRQRHGPTQPGSDG